MSAGGREAAYQRDGYKRFTVRELLAPVEATANLCHMHFLPPFVVHGTHRLTTPEIERHAADYRRTIEALRDGRLDLAAARDHPRINARLNELIGD